MKKIIFAITGTAMMVAATILYSCNKEGAEAANGSIGAEEILSKKETTYYTAFHPHFTYRNNKYTGWCKETGIYVCGIDIASPQNGDEACLLMRYASHPDDLYGMYIPFGILFANHAEEIIDSAKNGAMTFHADFNIYSDEIQEFAGTDLIPAGRYPATLTQHRDKNMVFIDLGEIM